MMMDLLSARLFIDGLRKVNESSSLTNEQRAVMLMRYALTCIDGAKIAEGLAPTELEEFQGVARGVFVIHRAEVPMPPRGGVQA